MQLKKANPKSKKKQLEALHESFGGVEELAFALKEECPDYLEGHAGLAEAAKALDIPPELLGRAVSQPEFQSALDRLASFSVYSFAHRQMAMENLKNIATRPEKTVMTRSGEPAMVDRDAQEMIQADTHLRKVQGRPLDEGKGKGGGLGIHIVFGGAEEQPTTITLTEGENEEKVADEDGGQGDDPPYRPNVRGDPPPEGARRFYRDPDERHAAGADIPKEFDFDREDLAEEEDVGTLAPGEAAGKPTREGPVGRQPDEVPPGMGSGPGREPPKPKSQREREEQREKERGPGR